MAFSVAISNLKRFITETEDLIVKYPHRREYYENQINKINAQLVLFQARVNEIENETKREVK